MLPEPQRLLPGEWPLAQGPGENDKEIGRQAGSSRNLSKTRALTACRGAKPSVVPRLLHQLGSMT